MSSPGPGVDRRWWIGEGSERCPFCLQGYAVEMEMRCVACDEPGCMHCVATVTVAEEPEILCPTCSPADPAGSPGPSRGEGR